MSTVQCYNPSCGQLLGRPAKYFTKCSYCSTDFFVFCHEFPFKLFEHNQCRKCPNVLYYFFCFKCNEVMCFNKYRMGSVSNCKKCGFSGCYVVCKNCRKPECFPPSQRYEGVAWKCEFCSKPFNFMTCDQCYHEIYRYSFNEGQVEYCENPKCRVTLRVKKCGGCKFVFIDSRNRNFCDPCFENNSLASHQPTNPVVVPPAMLQTNQFSALSVIPMHPPVFSMNTMMPYYHQAQPFSGLGSMMQQQQIIPAISHFPNQNIPLIPRQSAMNMQPNFQKQMSGLNSTFTMPTPNVGVGMGMMSNGTMSYGTMNPRATMPVMESAKEPAKLNMANPVFGIGHGDQNSQQITHGRSTLNDEARCKICLDKYATYVNKECFHMASCSMCVKKLKNQCPICRKHGEFRKVYK